MSLLKLLEKRDVNEFYFARYEDWGNYFVTILVKEEGHHYYYDILNNTIVSVSSISHIKPFTNYITFDKKSISLRTARKTGKILLSKFETDIKSEPARWEPKVLIKDTIPHLKVTNYQINETSKNEKELPTAKISENEERKDEDDWHKYYFRHHEDNIIELVRKGYWEDKKIFYGEVKASRDEVLRAAESLMNIQILVGGHIERRGFDSINTEDIFIYYQLLIGINPDYQVYEDAKNYFESFKHELSSEI